MSLTKEKAMSGEGGHRLRRWILGLVVFIPLSLFGLQQFTNHAAQSRLNAGRREFEKITLVTTAEERTAIAEQTVGLLRDLGINGEPLGETAKILSLAAEGVTSREDLNQRAASITLRLIDTHDLVSAGEVFFHSRRFEIADRLIEEALQRADDRERTLRVGALVYYELGREESVLKICEELALLRTDDSRPLLVQFQVYRDREHWPQACEVLRGALQRDPSSTQIRWLFTDALIRIGDAATARIEYSQLASDATRRVADLLLEARLLHLEGRLAESLKRVEAYLKSEPNNIDALLFKGQVMLSQGMAESAVASLQAVVKAEPTNQEGHYRLGQALSQIGQTLKSKEHLTIHRRLMDLKIELYKLERHAGRNPHDVDVRLKLAGLYEEIGLPSESVFWKRASETARKSASPTSRARELQLNQGQ